MGTVYTDDTRSAALSEYAAGGTLDSVSSSLGVPRNTIYGWVKQAGVPRRRRGRRSPFMNPTESGAAALQRLNTIRSLACKAMREGDMETVKALLAAEAQAVEMFNQEAGQ